MNPLAVVPLWGRALMLLALATTLIGFGWVKGAHHTQARWDAADVARDRAVAQAMQARLASNTKKAEQQAATNKTITEGKDHEIANLTARLDAAPRLRVGRAICGGPAAPTQAASPTSGDSTYPSGGLVRPDVERDIRALILDVETDLATGRACQAFVRENGLTP